MGLSWTPSVLVEHVLGMFKHPDKKSFKNALVKGFCCFGSGRVARILAHHGLKNARQAKNRQNYECAKMAGRKICRARTCTIVQHHFYWLSYPDSKTLFRDRGVCEYLKFQMFF